MPIAMAYLSNLMNLPHETRHALEKLLMRASCADLDAYNFLCSFTQYFHDIVDFIESVDPSTFKISSFLPLLARTCTVYSIPFYSRNAHFLHVPIQRAISNRALATAWKDHGQEWKREQARTLRLSISEVILAVAEIKSMPFSEKQQLAVDLLELLSAPRAAESSGPSKSEPLPLENVS